MEPTPPNSTLLPGETPQHPRGWLCAPFSLALLGLGMAFYPALFSGFERLQIRLGDPTLVHYIQEHSWRWIARLPLAHSYWNPACYAPFTNITAHSDVMLGTGPLYWIWRALGLGPGPSFQLWMMGCLALTFVAAHLFLRRHLRASPWSAATGAFLIGFGSSKLANFNSPQLFASFAGMFALLFLGDVLAAARGGRTRETRLWIVGFFCALVLQGWSAFYPTFFLGLVLVALGLAALSQAEQRSLLFRLARRHGPLIALCSVLAALALAPLALHYLEAARNSGLRSWPEVSRGLPTAASWLYPGKCSWLYGSLAQWDFFRFQSPQSQHANGVGAVTTSAALCGLLLGWRRPLVRSVALGGALLMITSMRWGESWSLWQFIHAHLPAAGAIRYLARIGHWLVIPAGMGVALLMDSRALRARLAPALLLGVLILAEQAHVLMARNANDYRACVERIAEQIPPQAPAFFLSSRAAPQIPPRLREARRRQVHLVAMWAAWEAGVPSANGFYGLDPAGWQLAITNPRNQTELRALERACSTSAPPGTVHLQLAAEFMPWNTPR